jgi:uroporphyrin-3 C-methyltransferase
MLSTELDELAALAAQAPLMVPDDVAPDPSRQGDVPADSKPLAPGAGSPSEPPANAPWWRKGLHATTHWSADAWAAIRQDLGEFIVVRRADDPTALLMSPDQATRFRESMGLRIMTAQLALMMRQPKIWHTEIGSLIKALETRYDGNDPRTQQALKLVRRLADTRIDTKLPTVDNSLKAIEAVREANIKASQDGALEQTLHSDTQGAPQESKAGNEVTGTEQGVEQTTPAEATSEPAEPAAENTGPSQETLSQPGPASAAQKPAEPHGAAGPAQQQSEPAKVPGASSITPQE